MSRGERRRHILEAARRCIVERGFERTSTARICEVAGVSSGTFFHYFPTKASLLASVLEDDLERTREAFGVITQAAEADATAGLDLWQQHVVATAVDEDLAAFVAASGASPDDMAVADVLATETDLTRRTLIAVVEAGRRQGTVRTDLPPERIAVWLQVLADGVLVQAVDERPSAARLRAELADAVVRLVRP